MRFLEIRGRAERAAASPSPGEGLSRQIIRIHPHRVITWNVDPDDPGLQARDLTPIRDEPAESRPSLDTDGSAARPAHDAVTRLVGELQEGLDQHDAETYNRYFADDVMWGSPFGATVYGYEQLHAIHTSLLQRGVGGPTSRYEIVRILAPTPDVAIAHVRRVALDAEGHPLGLASDVTDAFSEMALYVLIRRERTWWLVAGQNTPVRLGGSGD
jgi:uncharacterized protein (TIGR02246 family)